MFLYPATFCNCYFCHFYSAFLFISLNLRNIYKSHNHEKHFEDISDLISSAGLHVRTGYGGGEGLFLNPLDMNLKLLDKYPDYIFNFEGAVKYSWMKEYYPREYNMMKKYIRSGRWHISGASWDATDALVPSVESAIRNVLLGQDFYRNEFGVESTDIFLPDCFGFGWTLPAVASHCGLIGFSSQKLGWRHNPFHGDMK